jgi:hypothetical protein
MSFSLQAEGLNSVNASTFIGPGEAGPWSGTGGEQILYVNAGDASATPTLPTLDGIWGQGTGKGDGVVGFGGPSGGTGIVGIAGSVVDRPSAGQGLNYGVLGTGVSGFGGNSDPAIWSRR